MKELGDLNLRLAIMTFLILRSDIWSLGCILYELCACRRAFEAPTLPALIMKIIRGELQRETYCWRQDVRQITSYFLVQE